MVHFNSGKRIFFSEKAILKLGYMLVEFTEDKSEEAFGYTDESGGIKHEEVN